MLQILTQKQILQILKNIESTLIFMIFQNLAHCDIYDLLKKENSTIPILVYEYYIKLILRFYD